MTDSKTDGLRRYETVLIEPRAIRGMLTAFPIWLAMWWAIFRAVWAIWKVMR